MKYEEISVDELAGKLDGDSAAVLIDVRQPDEYAAGHVPGARLVPLGTVPDRLEELRGLGPLLVICRSGGRSGQACEFLTAQGVTATNIRGGTVAWMDSGRPLEDGDQPG